MQRMQRDLKSIMAVNEEYQVQANHFKEREQQYNDLSREYREKLEAVKFDRERIALKEEQFLRQIQKVESQSRQDLKRHQEKFESQLHSRKRESDRKVDDLEEKMTRIADECDSNKRMNERLQRENTELKRQVDQFITKEDRTITQYEKIMDQLKSEIKDKERQCHTIETREAYARQEINSKLKDLQLKNDDLKETVTAKDNEIVFSKQQIEELKDKLQKSEVQVQAYSLGLGA